MVGPDRRERSEIAYSLASFRTAKERFGRTPAGETSGGGHNFHFEEGCAPKGESALPRPHDGTRSRGSPGHIGRAREISCIYTVIYALVGDRPYADRLSSIRI